MISIANPKLSIRMPLVTGTVMSLVIGLSGAKSADPVVPPTSQHSPANVGPQQNPQTIPNPKPKRRWYQIGRASWYGHQFQGHPTASGESYNMNLLTCAHRSLPIGALLRVTNLRNSKTVVVRVNDRGPILENRIIDLSYAAAKTLGMDNKGVDKVRVEQMTGSELAQLHVPAA